jgi:HEAT repeat protein
MVKDKFWNVRAAAAVMLANLLEELKDLDDKERLSIR